MGWASDGLWLAPVPRQPLAPSHPALLRSSKLIQKSTTVYKSRVSHPQHPFFFQSSEALARAWRASGNAATTLIGSGGHCEIHSWLMLLVCLDDGSHRLLTHGVLLERGQARLPLPPVPPPHVMGGVSTRIRPLSSWSS